MKIIERIKTEWEATILIIAISSIVIVPIGWYFGFGQDDDFYIARPSREHRPQLLDDDRSFIFLASQPAEPLEPAVNPFLFTPPPEPEPELEPEAPPVTETEPRPRPRPRPRPTPETPPEVQPEVSEEPTPAAEPVEMRTIEFTGLIIDSQGRARARIKNMDSGEVRYVPTEDMFMSLVINNITTKQLEVSLPSGETAKIDFGQQLTYEVE